MHIIEITRKRPRIAIIVNKRREVEGFLKGLEESGFLPNILIKDRNTPPAPCYRMSDLRLSASLEKMDLIIRCIEDMMPPADKRVPETSGSHSQQKAMLLPGYLRDYDADLMISVSTAESPPELQTEAIRRFCTPPHSPADPMQILCDPNYISVAAINVVHYQAYEQADPAAYLACMKEHGDKYPASYNAGMTVALFLLELDKHAFELIKIQ